MFNLYILIYLAFHRLYSHCGGQNSNKNPLKERNIAFSKQFLGLRNFCLLFSIFWRNFNPTIWSPCKCYSFHYFESVASRNERNVSSSEKWIQTSSMMSRTVTASMPKHGKISVLTSQPPKTEIANRNRQLSRSSAHCLERGRQSRTKNWRAKTAKRRTLKRRWNEMSRNPRRARAERKIKFAKSFFMKRLPMQWTFWGCSFLLAKLRFELCSVKLSSFWKIPQHIPSSLINFTVHTK